MKKLLSIVVLIALVACNGGLESHHETRYSADGKDSVVFIMYYDGKQYNNMCLNYEQFTTLYNEGGYEACYEYSIEHEQPTYWKERYSEYKRK